MQIRLQQHSCILAHEKNGRQPIFWEIWRPASRHRNATASLYIIVYKASAPVAPLTPEKPVAPVGPRGPRCPVCPVAPTVPFGPWRPVAPVSPAKPVLPVNKQSTILVTYVYADFTESTTLVSYIWSDEWLNSTLVKLHTVSQKPHQ